MMVAMTALVSSPLSVWHQALAGINEILMETFIYQRVWARLVELL